MIIRLLSFYLWCMGKNESILLHLCLPLLHLHLKVLFNKSVNIIRSSDLDILKGYNPKIRTWMIFFFSSHTTNSRILAYHWILVHIINISTLKEQIASYSEGIFAAESKDCATGQENHLWVNLKSRPKSERMLGQRSHPQSNMEQSQLHKMLSLEVSPSPNWILVS